MNLLVLADYQVSKFCFRNQIFRKLNSWESLEQYLKDQLPASILDRSLFNSEKISKELDLTGFRILSIYDPKYPPLLKEIYDPPLILFYKGNLNILNLSYAAVVGTRNPSPISVFASELFPSYLKNKGFSGIVSGLAKGIDAVSMNSALDEDLAVIGVMGTGPEKEYPYENKMLYQRINSSNRTLILTEYPPGQKF